MQVSFNYMEQIQNFRELHSYLSNIKNRKTFVFVHPYDEQTVSAFIRAIDQKIIKAILIGNKNKIHKIFKQLDIKLDYPENILEIQEISEPKQAADLAVKLVKEGKADGLMKGLINTDIILSSVLNKDTGIVNYGDVISFVAAIEIPNYHKLLLVCDPAVIPAPNLRQFQEMIKYSIGLSQNLGTKTPKIALIHATEKKNLKLRGMQEYLDLLLMHENEPFGDAIIDGPMDLYIAINKEMGGIKEVNTPILGDADVLIFPSIESGNVFYKSVMSFGGAQMGGMLFGTLKPVILTSRSDSTDSKFNSIALACLFS